MRVLVFGNSGSGKSTYARALAEREGLAHLDLDSIVWEPGQVAVLRSPESIHQSLEQFLAQHDRWVIEGCYGELVEAAAPRCTQLVFLNPGLAACLANNTRRPWEPHKYASPEQQDAMRSALSAWVADYYHRTDQWSYQAHRRIFDAHAGAKIEHTTLTIYFAASISGGRGDQGIYAQIIALLKQHGTVLTEHLGDASLTAAGEALGDREIHDRDIQWLRQADVLVAEVTTPSLGVGYEIGRAVEWGKRIICLHRPAAGRRLSGMIAGCSGVTLLEYQGIGDLRVLLRHHLPG